MKMLSFNILVVGVFYLVTQCSAYPSGAPLDQCKLMMPQHGAEPQRGEPPFEIKVKPIDSHHYNVTIIPMDQGHFKGFLLEARGRWDGKTIGTWETSVHKTKTIDCFNFTDSAVTHHLGDDKFINLVNEVSKFHETSFQWIRPESEKLNRVKFIATIVQHYKTIYLNVSTTLKVKEFDHLKPLTTEIDINYSTNNSTN